MQLASGATALDKAVSRWPKVFLEVLQATTYLVPILNLGNNEFNHGNDTTGSFLFDEDYILW